MGEWLSEKQKNNKVREELSKLKKEKKKIRALLDERRNQNTHNSRMGQWTLPDIHITISVSELEKIMN